MEGKALAEQELRMESLAGDGSAHLPDWTNGAVGP